LSAWSEFQLHGPNLKLDDMKYLKTAFWIILVMFSMTHCRTKRFPTASAPPAYTPPPMEEVRPSAPQVMEGAVKPKANQEDEKMQGQPGQLESAPQGDATDESIKPVAKQDFGGQVVGDLNLNEARVTFEVLSDQEKTSPLKCRMVAVHARGKGFSSMIEPNDEFWLHFTRGDEAKLSGKITCIVEQTLTGANTEESTFTLLKIVW
jgi:hypothetical protein